MEEWVKVADADALEDEGCMPIENGGQSLALYRVDGEFFCTDNVCSHAFALLSDGWLEGHLIECPLHNGQFDVRTGKGQGPPITTDIRAYKTKVEDGAVFVRLG